MIIKLILREENLLCSPPKDLKNVLRKSLRATLNRSDIHAKNRVEISCILCDTVILEGFCSFLHHFVLFPFPPLAFKFWVLDLPHLFFLSLSYFT